MKDTLKAALARSPIVFLEGARQVGKSTLAKTLLRSAPERRYFTFDDRLTLASAEADANSFLSQHDGPITIDEVQRCASLPLVLKMAVDTQRTAGRFLLTGSAGVLVLPQLADALAGRMEILTLWPLSQGELAMRRENFIEALFDRSHSLPDKGEPWRDIIVRMTRGGFPESLAMKDPAGADAWFDNWLATILQRDIRQLADIHKLMELPRLVRLVAARTGQLVNYADLSSGLQMPQSTLKNYMGLLLATFVLRLLPAWSSNLGTRLIKAPKIFLCDTGLLCHSLGFNAERLSTEPTAAGHVLENFVMMELVKQLGWSAVRAEIFHFRTPAGREVDFVIERPTGEIVGIEVKAGATVGEGDFRGLAALAEIAGKRFVRGVVLYAGSRTATFGKNLLAVPISALWA